MKKIILLLTTCICFSGVYSQTVSIQDKISELNKQMEKCFQENDMMKVASFYLDSALISGGRMNATGRYGIDQYWMALKDKSGQWKLETELTEDFGGYVLQRGKSFLKFEGFGGNEHESNVRFFIIWKKTEDTYKILYDVFKRL